MYLSTFAQGLSVSQHRSVWACLFDPVIVAVRAWLWVQSLCCLWSGQATHTERFSSYWVMLLELAGRPLGQKRSIEEREDMCHQATDTAGWSWQPHSWAAAVCFNNFGRHATHWLKIINSYIHQGPSNVHEVTVMKDEYENMWAISTQIFVAV